MWYMVWTGPGIISLFNRKDMFRFLEGSGATYIVDSEEEI